LGGRGGPPVRRRRDWSSSGEERLEHRGRYGEDGDVTVSNWPLVELSVSGSKTENRRISTSQRR
jgi:hypothetical protein